MPCCAGCSELPSCRFDGSEARKRCNKYGGALFPFTWYDLQQFWARQLPEGALKLNSDFDSYEEQGDSVTVHLTVRRPRTRLKKQILGGGIAFACVGLLAPLS